MSAFDCWWVAASDKSVFQRNNAAIDMVADFGGHGFEEREKSKIDCGQSRILKISFLWFFFFIENLELEGACESTYCGETAV
jgi:hypothetical protein